MQDSQKCTFDVDGLADYIDLNSFRFSLVAYTTDKIAIATSRYLSILGGTTYQREKDNDTIQTVVEFGEVSGRPTAIQWLTHDFLCVGFESGSFACFNDFGETIAEHTVYSSPVIALRVTVTDDNADSILWALHENGYFISVSVKYLFSDNYKRAIVKYKLNTLTSTLQFNDFIFLGNVSYATLQDTGSTDGRFGTCILAGGQDPSISLYNISKQAKNMRDKLASSISKTVTNALTSFFGNTERPPEEASSTAVYHFADPKRVVLRLSIDPSLQLIAAADSLGRVMLYDKRLFAVIRLWKGVREARLAWTEGTQNEKRTMCLVIYAPQTGLLSLYAMKHGPCLRSIPVGPHCHIFTIYEMTNESSCQCLLLRQNNNQLMTTELLPFGYSDEDIDLSSEANFAFATPRKDDLQDIVKLQRIVDRILTTRSVYDAEQRLWLNLCHVHDLEFVEKCLSSIDSYERDYYYKNRDGRGFSLVFQRNLCRLFNLETAGNSIKTRNRLLKAYELLVDMNHQTSMNVLESSPPPGTEKNKWFKQNDIRAEAICWSARLLALQSEGIPLPHTPLKHHDSFITDAGHGRLATRTPSPLRNDSLSSSNASNDMPVSPRSPPQPLSPKKSGIVKPNSSMYRTTSFMQSSVVLPFAIFTSFFFSDGVLSFQATKILNEIKVLRRDVGRGEVAGELAPLSTLFELLQFMFLPLLGDAFALNSFIRILDHMNIAMGYNVMHILPLIIVFMEKQNFSIIFNTQVNKSLSSSSIQRWLRDTILEFQSFITPSSSENIFSDMEGEAVQLLQEIISARKTPNEAADLPSFDEAVRYILRPSWMYLRTSVNLECAMIVTSQVIEVLEAINDQLERRTYGASTLIQCKTAWYTLFRQLRVTLLLSSRVGGGLSIDKLGGGDISIYNLLAADTLCFALEPDQAVEHEMRCHEVYARRTKLDKDDSSALLAWGPLADQRWKELLAVAEAEDTTDEKKVLSPRKKKIRRRRPLLLFFPSHNHPAMLGAYRSLILAERWLNRPRKVDFLALCAGHLLPLPEPLRAAVANEICKVAILPLLLAYLELEEGVVHRERSNEYVHEMLQIMANSDLVEKFVQSSVDILHYAARIHNVINSDAFHMHTASADSYSDESGPEIWPPLHDARISTMMEANIDAHEKDAKWTICLLYVLQMRAQYGLRGVKPSELFGRDFLSSSRRKKDVTVTADILSHSRTPVDAPAFLHNLHTGCGLDEIRKEFLLQCFRRIGAQSTQTIYHIAVVWSFSLQQIRLLHLLILLELNLDEQVEEVISQIDSIPQVIDLVIQGIRSRLGHTVSLIDRIPACGPLLASLDPDASNWARDAVTTPDSATVTNVVKGKTPLLSYDIKSSRHLVIRVQALLLTIPSSERDDIWRIRKSRSDSLLAVCSSFASASLQNTLKDTGIQI